MISGMKTRRDGVWVASGVRYCVASRLGAMLAALAVGVPGGLVGTAAPAGTATVALAVPAVSAATAVRALLTGATAVLGLSAPSPARAAAFTLADLMALLARQGAGEARFTEQRYVQGIDAPLASSGTLSFAAPDRLTRRTLAPRAESFEVAGNTLAMTRGGRSRTVALDSAPELAAVIEALRGTLTGNAAALQRQFDSRLAGSADGWTLDLTPLDARLAAQVQGLRIGGRQAEVRSVEMRYAGGDRSVMTIEPVRLGVVAPSPAASVALPAR